MIKTIKIFLASSEELKEDRVAFGNLVRQLDDIYLTRGIHVKLIVWEELTTTLDMSRPRTQDEYDDKVRESDIFVAMFHTRAGQYTREEVAVAMDENAKRKVPQLLIYCKDLQPGEREDPELTEFKQRLDGALEHFWRRYSISDTMHLNFVMWLNRTEALGNDALKVEDGEVTMDGVPVARMDNLPFAAGNADYQEMQDKLTTLNEEIGQLEQAVEQMPTMTALKGMLQGKYDERILLRDKLAQYQKALLDTAKRIAEMELETLSGTLKRAVEAFDGGNLERANALLDEIAHEADHHMARLDQDRALVHQDIDAFRLQAKTVMADVNIPIADRIARVAAIYAKADDWAGRSAYDKEKYAYLLLDYASFLRDYAHYDEADEICQRLIALSKELYGTDSKETATSYNNIGMVYAHQGEYSKALEYFFKALAIAENVLGVEHPSTATSYSNIGVVYAEKGEYTKALEYYFKALAVREKELELNHPDTAMSYSNIGAVYCRQGEYANALECHLKALAIREKELGLNHPDTALSYNNIGGVYSEKGEYDKSLEYYFKALVIHEKALGANHPLTALSYNNIGAVYDEKGEYDKALEYYFNALAILVKVLGLNHPDTATSYSNIGVVYDEKGDYSKALEFFFKALAIEEKVLGLNHPDTATSYSNIGVVYYRKGEYDKALEYLGKALAIDEKVVDPYHPIICTVRENIEAVKAKMGQSSTPSQAE